MVCSKITRGVMDKNSVIYETNQVVGGFQTTVKMPRLPNEWGNHVWAGEVCPLRPLAEQSAAGVALQEIMNEPFFVAAMAVPSANKEKKAANWRMRSGGQRAVRWS